METASASEYQCIRSRFTDVSNESMRQLPPIEGYENMPLVSLEKAVEPISDFFDSINDYVRVAKEKCTYPTDNLSPDESASIYLYTMEFSSGRSFYTVLNRTLRAEQRRDIKQWFLYLKLFCTALRKIPSKNMQVWRCVAGIDLLSKFELEKEIVWWGVSSCSENMSDLIKSEHLKKDGLRTVFAINSFNAKNIVSHSHYPNEKELILMPGSCFKVKDISEPHPKLYFINLEQTQSEYSIIESPFPKMTDQNYISQTKSNSTNTSVQVHRVVLYETKPSVEQTANIQPVFTPNVQPLSAANLQTVTPPHIQQAGVQNINTEPKATVYTSYESPDDRDSAKKGRKKAKRSIMVFCLLTFFPIATLVFGQLYKNDCPIQPMIPQWMWIFGAVGLGGFGFIACMGCMILSCCPKKRKVGCGFGGFILCLLILFFLGWLITGSIWLFPVHTKVNFGGNITSNYCNESLYKFTFGTLLAMYSLVGVVLLFGLCMIYFAIHG